MRRYTAEIDQMGMSDAKRRRLEARRCTADIGQMGMADAKRQSLRSAKMYR